MRERAGVGAKIRNSVVLKVAIAIAIIVALLWVLMAMASPDPVGALGGLLTGAVSSPGRVAQWLTYSSFLMLTGVSVCLVFRAGLFSIGAEGQVLVGALLGGAVGLALPPSAATLPIAIIASMLGGFIWGLIPGLLKAYLAADEIVTTLMMNYVATFLFAFVIKESLQPPDAGFPVSDFLPNMVWFPIIGDSPGVSTTLILGVLACVLMSFVINRSRFGYSIRMVGESPKFAHANGMRVSQLVWLSIALSGAIAGAAGAAIAFGGTHRLIVGMAAGIGFDGILVALLALNRPLLVPVMALAYGFIRTGGDVIQISSNVPRDVVVVLQGVIILALAAAIRQRERKKRSLAPVGASQATALDEVSSGRASDTTLEASEEHNATVESDSMRGAGDVSRERS